MATADVQMKNLLLIVLLAGSAASRLNRNAKTAKIFCSSDTSDLKERLLFGLLRRRDSCQCLFNLGIDLTAHYADRAFKDSSGSHFTSTLETCAKLRQEVGAAPKKVRKTLPVLDDVLGDKDFQTRTAGTAMIQSVQENRRVGCEQKVVPTVESDFVDEVVAGLQEAFVRTRQANDDKGATAFQRFNNTLQVIRDHSSASPPKNITKLFRVALGDYSDGGISIGRALQVANHLDKMSEDVLAESTTGALLQLHDGQFPNISSASLPLDEIALARVEAFLRLWCTLSIVTLLSHLGLEAFIRVLSFFTGLNDQWILLLGVVRVTNG